MSYRNKNFSLFLILFELLLLLILDYADLAASSSCQKECGGINIPYPFGIGGKDCYLDEYYEIECRNTTSTSRKVTPFLSVIEKEVVSFSFPDTIGYYTPLSFGLVKVRNAIASAGCSSDRKEPAESILNLTGSPFFSDGVNRLVAFGCNSKVSFTHVQPNIVGCELNCSMIKESDRNRIPFFSKTGCSSNNFLSYSSSDVCPENISLETDCNGIDCCLASLPQGPQQVIGIRIESNDVNSTTRGHCRVAFLSDTVYTALNATKPEQLFAKGSATVTLGWVIQAKNTSFLNYLPCKGKYEYNNARMSDLRRIQCICEKITAPEISYANCGCNSGYIGNPYVLDGCLDIDECESGDNICDPKDTCVNTVGSYRCLGDKTKAIVTGVGSGFGILVFISGLWWLRKFLLKRRMTNRKKKFFKRNGGLLLQQELNTRESNVERTRIFSSRELEKATENFSENRVLGRGGQGTVYKGMLVDGRTVAVKKSKVIDEDKLQEFINEVVILSQINHRHIVKLLGCCLETEVQMLVYEFIINGNLFQHIHEESDDYTMVWGMRLRIAVDTAGALAYLHSSASSPIYHRDIKSTNILLDEKHRAKVSDFGTSRSITIDQTHWTTVISGTVGMWIQSITGLASSLKRVMFIASESF